MCGPLPRSRACCPAVTSRGHSAVPVNNSPQAVPADLVSVREAGQAVGVTPAAVYKWIKRGQLAVQPSSSGRRVSLAAVQALVPPPAPPAPADAVAIYEALRLTDVTRRNIEAWVTQGRLPSWHGRHGRLVRVADVQALAQQRDMMTAAAGDGTPMPPDALLIRDVVRLSGVTKSRIYLWMKKGLLPTWLVPGVGQRVRLADVVALAERPEGEP